MKSYRAFGLQIASEFDVALAAADDAPADVHIRSARLAVSAASNGCVRSSGSETLLAWDRAGTFLVRGGQEIVVDARADADPRFLGHLLGGPVLAVAVHQRGRLVLHASAVSAGGRVVAFLGAAGGGKSTVAAALQARGWGAVTDDVLVVDVIEGRPVVHPGFAGFRLWPAAARALNLADAHQEVVDSTTEKRLCGTEASVAADPLALRCVYALTESADERIEPMDPPSALLELIRHTYTARVLESRRKASNFQQCARLVNDVPVRRVLSPRSSPRLVALADRIENDLAVV